MILEKLEIVISFFAALIVAIVGIIWRVPYQNVASTMLIVLPSFFIIGFFIKIFLKKNVFSKTSDDLEENIPQVNLSENENDLVSSNVKSDPYDPKPINTEYNDLDVIDSEIDLDVDDFTNRDLEPINDYENEQE